MTFFEIQENLKDYKIETYKENKAKGINYIRWKTKGTHLYLFYKNTKPKETTKKEKYLFMIK